MMEIRTEKVFAVFLLLLSGFLLFESAQSQDNGNLDFIMKVPLTNEGKPRGVRADDPVNKWHRWAGTIPARSAGYYKFMAQAEYSIEKPGEIDQHNESFYFTVIARDSTPLSPNAGPYRVIPDSMALVGKAWRNGGTFYLSDRPDTLSLWMHHYAAIAKKYPQHLLGGITYSEMIESPNSVKFDTLIWVVRDSPDRVEDGALEIAASAPRTELINGAEHGLVYSGEVIHYKLIVRNPGKNVITSGRLHNKLPSYVIATNFSCQPIEIEQRDVVWELPYIFPRDSLVITFDATMPAKMPVGLTPLIDAAVLDIPHDQNAANDSASVTVYALADSDGVKPNLADVGITLTSETGTVNSYGMSTVKRGGAVSYDLKLFNDGPDFAKNVQLTNTITQYFSLKNISLQPDRIAGQTLEWEFASIQPYSSLTISYDGDVSPAFPENDSLVITQAQITAANDVMNDNNAALDTVLVLAKNKNFDVSLTHKIASGEFTIVQGDTFPAVREGNSYSHEILIRNHGPQTAYRLNVWSRIPDSVSVHSFNIAPASQKPDTLFWIFDSLTTYQSLQISYSTTCVQTLPIEPFEIVSVSEVIAEHDTLLSNNHDSAVVYGIKKKPPVPTMTDLSLKHSVQTDSMIVIAGDTVQAVAVGSSYQHELVVQNHGPAKAYDVALWSKLPDSVSVVSYSVTPTRQSSDTLFWTIDSLAVGAIKQYTYQTRLADSLPHEPFALTSVSEVAAANDTLLTNNRDSATVFGIRKRLPVSIKMDLSLTHSVQTDSMIVIAGDTVQAVAVGSSYQHELVVQNHGPAKAYDVALWSKLPDSVSVVNYTVAPTRQSSDTLFWHLDSLDVLGISKFGYETRLAASLPFEPFELLSVSEVTAANDTLLDNNHDSAVVYGLKKKLPLSNKTDLALTHTIQTDSLVVVAGDTVQAVVAGTTYRHDLLVKNLGPVKAVDLVLWSKLPDSINVVSYTVTPSRQHADTLFWAIDSLRVDEAMQFWYVTQLSAELPVSPFILESVSEVQAEQDTFLVNNRQSVKAYGIAPAPVPSKATDLAIELHSITDSTVVVNGRLGNGVAPGDDYSYLISVKNYGPRVAEQIRVTQILPEFVTFLSSIPAPVRTTADSVLWEFASLESLTESAVDVSVELSGEIQLTIKEIYSSVIMTAANDSTDYNNSDLDTVLVLHKKPEPAAKKSDVALSYFAVTDTFAVIAGDTVHAAFAGDAYKYNLMVKNYGPSVVHNLMVWTTAPDSVHFSHYDIEPAEQKNDTLYWKIDSLSISGSWMNSLDALVAPAISSFPYELSSISQVVAAQDSTDDNNSATAIVYVIAPEEIAQLVDVSVSQYALTDSFAVENSDTLKFARESEVYTYFLVVKNLSSVAAKNVLVKDLLPDSVNARTFDPLPLRTEEDTLMWIIEELPGNGLRILRVDAAVAEVMPIGINHLVNRLWTSAENEDPEKMGNNTSISKIYNKVRNIGILSPQIQASPPSVDVTENILVRVQIPKRTATWDLWIYLPDGSIDKTFADDFIFNNKLTPDIWYDIDKAYTPSILISTAKAEDLIFEIRTKDIYGNAASAQATVQVRSSNYLVLDRNVFKPEAETPLGIRFKLSNRRVAQLDIYDVSGKRIKEITRGEYQGGWNVYPWDGMGEDGLKVGSGVYLVTLRSGEFNSWKKFILVR